MFLLFSPIIYISYLMLFSSPTEFLSSLSTPSSSEFVYMGIVPNLYAADALFVKPSSNFLLINLLMGDRLFFSD